MIDREMISCCTDRAVTYAFSYMSKPTSLAAATHVIRCRSSNRRYTTWFRRRSSKHPEDLPFSFCNSCLYLPEWLTRSVAASLSNLAISFPVDRASCQSPTSQRLMLVHVTTPLERRRHSPSICPCTSCANIPLPLSGHTSTIQYS